jgi:type VI secretion system protein ImpB
MSNRYQKACSKARVNITLNVESNHSNKKIELPMKLLVLGDFSSGNARGTLSDRARLNVKKNNLNQLMDSLKPSLTLRVPNHLHEKNENLKIDLQFQKMSDFMPGQIAEQVPELKKLLAMRLLLKDLKANVLDNHAFRKALEVILKSKEKSHRLLLELEGLGGEKNKKNGGVNG